MIYAINFCFHAKLTRGGELRFFDERPTRKAHKGSGVNIRTLCFRGCDLILESNEEDLVRDARRDPDRAQVKLEKIRQRSQNASGTICGSN
jgi:hypothetical protein